MELFARLLLIMGIWAVIEVVDYNVNAVNFPWWLSLLMAAFCSVGDIITIFIIDWITNDC